MSEKVRVLRILEYVGDRELVEETLQKGSVPADGVKIIGNNNQNIIKSCLIDKFPEILENDNIQK